MLLHNYKAKAAIESQRPHILTIHLQTQDIPPLLYIRQQCAADALTATAGIDEEPFDPRFPHADEAADRSLLFTYIDLRLCQLFLHLRIQGAPEARRQKGMGLFVPGQPDGSDPFQL